MAFWCQCSHSSPHYLLLCPPQGFLDSMPLPWLAIPSGCGAEGLRSHRLLSLPPTSSFMQGLALGPLVHGPKPVILMAFTPEPQPPVPCTWPGTGPPCLSSPGAPTWQPVMPGEEAMPCWARSHQLRGLGSPWTWERGRFRPTHHVLRQAALHPEAAGPGLRATNAPGRSQPHPAALCPMTEDLLPAMDRAEL